MNFREAAIFIETLRSNGGYMFTDGQARYLHEAARLLGRAASEEECPDVTNAKILRGFQKGDVVFIETDRPMKAVFMEHMARSLNEALDGAGVKVVILEAGMKVAAREERPAGVFNPPVALLDDRPVADVVAEGEELAKYLDDIGDDEASVRQQWSLSINDVRTLRRAAAFIREAYPYPRKSV